MKIIEQDNSMRMMRHKITGEIGVCLESANEGDGYIIKMGSGKIVTGASKDFERVKVQDENR